jgi:DNA polymerase alpha subunit A
MQVKYPAAQPALPLGLTGATFCALFGANQSPLESLVLKRRLMGPSWLAVKQPRRVAPETQVRRRKGEKGSSGLAGPGEAAAFRAAL